MKLVAQVAYQGPWLSAEWMDDIHHDWLLIDGVGARHRTDVRFKYVED